MRVLGIYFGSELISIVESSGRKVISNIQLFQKDFLAGELEEGISPELKMIARFNDEMRKNNLKAQAANLALSGKDLIIRTFELPVMPREDLLAAIHFEAKKYIPFKAEELTLGYQLFYDRANQNNLVLLVGIKKETLQRYLSLFNQIKLKVISVEYAAFSILRLLPLSGLRTRGISAVVAADTQEQDEAHFMVLENGFPLFSRDVILKGGPEQALEPEKMSQEIIIEKLKSELRVSLDYYQRKFPNKKIEKIFFICSRDCQPDLDLFTKDIGLGAQFADIERFLGKRPAFSLSFLKGYSSSLSRVVGIVPKIDLVSAKAGPLKRPVAIEKKAPLLKDLHLEPPIIILSLTLCLFTFAFGIYQKLPLEKKIKEIKQARPKVLTVDTEASYETLATSDSEYKRKLAVFDKLIRNQLYLTLPLNIIPRLIPEGVWLSNFSFKKIDQDRVELILKGAAYLADSEKEFETVNKFISGLKEDPEFNKYFKGINVTSIDQGRLEKLAVTNFSISCRTY